MAAKTPKPGDDRAHRQAEREQRAAVDARDVANREDVAEIGNDLAAEADGEPGRDDVLHGVDEPAVAGHVGEPHRRRQRERAGDEQDQEVPPLELERGGYRAWSVSARHRSYRSSLLGLYRLLRQG